MNPPYGREIVQWIQKAWDEKANGVTTVCLVPARTDTQWWSIFWDHENHVPRDWEDEVRFVKGRIRFEGAPASAPFPSAIIVMRGETTKKWCAKCGAMKPVDAGRTCGWNRACGLNQDTYNEKGR
jgi:site-specific DNA-methyltransferase (adenine-specific)